MVVLYVVLGALLLLVLLLLIPVRVRVDFQEEFRIQLRYLFLRYTLLPAEEKPEEATEQQEEEASKNSFPTKLKQILKREGTAGFLKSLFEFVNLVKDSSQEFISHVHLSQFDLYLCLDGAGDASEAAIQYGEISAAVYSACGFLFGWKKCRRKAVLVDLNYKAEKSNVRFTCRLSASPLFALWEILHVLKGGLPFLRKFR